MAQYALEAGASWLGTSLSAVASGTWQIAKYTHRWMTSDEEEDEVPEQVIVQMVVDREKEFHNYVRQQIICAWLFMLLYLSAYWVISRLKRKTEREALYAGEEDYFVYRVSVWISSTALGTSLGSLTLLPFSVMGVELIQLYDGNYYLQWLSVSLIGALWNYVFMLSNLSLFVLLPFSYFFIESQGFSAQKIGGSGMTQRVYEAMAISFLFAFVLLCLAEVALTILDFPISFLSITSVNLPLIYSCVSFTGALLLLISTPYGFAKMFSFAREFFMEDTPEVVAEQPEQEDVVEESRGVPTLEDEVVVENSDDVEFRKDSDSGIESGSLEEMRLSEEDDVEEEEEDSEATMKFFESGDHLKTPTTSRRRPWRKHNYGASPEVPKPRWTPPKPTKNYDYRNFDVYVREARRSRSESEGAAFNKYEKYEKYEDFLKTSTPTPSEEIEGGAMKKSRSEESITWKWSPVFHKVKKTELFRKAEEKRGKLMNFLRQLRLPVVVTMFLVLTTCSLIMVAINTFKLLFGFRSLPVYAQYIEVHTRHSFGLFGAMIETLIILYVMVTSFVGLYSLPILRSLRPVRKDTPMPTIIINSSIILVVASALPVIVNTVGLTTFDLLGEHSSLQWLGNFRVVVAYNCMFLVLSGAFLFNQLTASMRRQIWKWILNLRCSARPEDADDTIVILSADKKTN